MSSVSPSKPNLFIVGALKCGTTAWFQYLRSHPDVFMSDVKEPCFFAYDLPNWRFVRSEDEYSDLFAQTGEAKVVGEASAIYLMSEVAAGAIRNYNPAAKILILLRDQDEYLPSLHNQFLSEFAEDIEDFEQAWLLSGRRPTATIPVTSVEPRCLDYASMGRFSEQVDRYLKNFPAEQVRVIWFRDWVEDPRSAYLEILRFLDLEDDGRTEFPRVNPGVTFRSRRFVRFLLYPPGAARKIARLIKRVTGLGAGKLNRYVERLVELLSAPTYKRELRPELREEIRRYYAEDNRRLEERLRDIRTAPPEDRRKLAST